jgi:hypothetical protein
MMKISTSLKYALLIAGTVLGLLGLSRLVTGGNIDPANKYAWGTNAGWINFAPSHGGGVTVCSDHLEGYAWAENVGWIRLGSYAGGGAHTYGNTSAADYGVNRDGSGALSGYAWSTNAGWINFAPSHGGGVNIDPDTGSFDGYAWGENIGWIHFKNTSPAYNVAVRSYEVYLPVVLRDYVSYFEGPWEREDNDTPEQANGALYSGRDYYGRHDDGSDYYSFYAHSSGAMTVDLSTSFGTGVQLQVFYQSVDDAHNVDYKWAPPYDIDFSGAAGWYYINVYTVPGQQDSTQYTLQVTYP